jgi:hypothetical protein
MQTYLPQFLLELVKYGPKYLSGEELESRIGQHLKQYYRFLGEQVYKRRSREFWNYHKNQLASLGYPMSVSRLAAAAVVKGVVWPLRQLVAMASR